jgi:hypothetical protein
MIEFEWLPLTWDAVATFMTGMAAVIGAALIGLRQTKITEIQAKIQRDQLVHDQLFRSNEFRFQLLDRRSECIGKLKAINQAFHEKVELNGNDHETLFQTIRDAELIFQPDVIYGLRKVATKTLQIPVAYRAQRAAEDRGDSKKAQDWLDKVINHENAVFEALPALIESMISATRISEPVPK